MAVLETSAAAPTQVPAVSLTARRALFAALVIASMAALLWLMASALSVGGIGALDVIILILFAMTLPWLVIGFWNAAIGFLIMRFPDDPSAAVLPVTTRIRGHEPVTASTAILVCIRNEAPERVIRHLSPMLTGLTASGYAQRFH